MAGSVEISMKKKCILGCGWRFIFLLKLLVSKEFIISRDEKEVRRQKREVLFVRDYLCYEQIRVIVQKPIKVFTQGVSDSGF
jgi:hypothetical protein